MANRRRGVAVAVLAGVLAVAVVGLYANLGARPAQKANSDAIALAEKLNAELERLQATNDPQKMIAIFADDAVRMDPNRPATHGKDAVLQSMTLTQKKPVQVLSAKAHVLNAWQTEKMLFEYGTVDARLKTPGGIVEDPTNFFLAWVVDPAASAGYKVQFSIWNTSRPVSQTQMLATKK